MQRIPPRTAAFAAAMLLVAACPWGSAQLPPAPPTAPTAIPPPPAPPPPMDVMPSVDVSSRVSPKFPGFDAIYSLGGRVVLDVTIASNGAITNMYIERSSGHRELDDSALEAVRQWQFTPGSRQGTRVGSVVRIPVNFNPQPSGEAPHNRLWPEAYAHPRYVADSSPIGYSSVDGAFEQVPADAHRSLQGAHPIEQLLVHDAHGQLVQWWIFTDLDTPNAMATRLVFGGTADDPVVAVASLCTRAVVCAARKTETLQGPSFARSP